jgi:hypothetical protein
MISEENINSVINNNPKRWGKLGKFRKKKKDVSQDPIADEKWIWKEEAKGGGR